MSQSRWIPKARTIGVLHSALTVVLVSLLPIPAYASHEGLIDKTDRGRVELISVDSDEAQKVGNSGSVECPNNPLGGVKWDGASMSGDGRYLAFTSTASLTPDNAGPLLSEVYVRDRQKGTTTLESVNPMGLPAEVPPDLSDQVKTLCYPWSFNPQISGNGRYLAFTSYANLTDGVLAGDLNPLTNLPFLKVYLRDLKKGRTDLISKSWRGDPSLAGSGMKGVSISHDGSVVAFISEATDLVEGQDSKCAASVGDSRPCRQAYAFHRRTGKISLISVSHDGTEMANNEIFGAEVSGNGRYVMFDSPASNLVQNDDNICPRLLLAHGLNCPDVFLRDLRKERTEIVSLGLDGTSANEASYRQAGSDMGTNRRYISHDGRYVLFNSSAMDLVPSGMGGIFVRDRETGRTERVSVNSNGAQITASWESISADGRYIMQLANDSCFLLECLTDLHPIAGTTVYDRATGQLNLVKLHRKGQTYTNLQEDRHPATMLSPDARYLVWTTSATSYVNNDQNGDDLDVLIRELGEPRLGALPADMGSYPRISVLDEPNFSRTGMWQLKPEKGPSTKSRLANVYSARVAYRPERRDLYVRIDLDGIEGVGRVISSASLYGLDLTIGGIRYEVRASMSSAVPVKLFRCIAVCDQVATLKGGYGTVGEAIVATIPLAQIGLQDGGVIEEITPVTTTDDLTSRHYRTKALAKGSQKVDRRLAS